MSFFGNGFDFLTSGVPFQQQQATPAGMLTETTTESMSHQQQRPQQGQHQAQQQTLHARSIYDQLRFSATLPPASLPGVAAAGYDESEETDGSYATASLATASLMNPPPKSTPLEEDDRFFDAQVDEALVGFGLDDMVPNQDSLEEWNDDDDDVQQPKNDNLQLAPDDLVAAPMEDSDDDLQQGWPDAAEVSTNQDHVLQGNLGDTFTAHLGDQTTCSGEPQQGQLKQAPASAVPEAAAPASSSAQATTTPVVGADKQKGKRKANRTVSKRLSSVDTQKTCVTFVLPTDENNNNNDRGKKKKRKTSKAKNNNNANNKRTFLNSPPLRRGRGWAPGSVTELAKKLQPDLDECSVLSRQQKAAVVAHQDNQSDDKQQTDNVSQQDNQSHDKQAAVVAQQDNQSDDKKPAAAPRLRKDKKPAPLNNPLPEGDKKKPPAPSGNPKKDEETTKLAAGDAVVVVGGEKYILAPQEPTRKSKRRRKPSIERILAMEDKHFYPKRRHSSPATYAGLEASDEGEQEAEPDPEEEAAKKSRRRNKKQRRTSITINEPVVENQIGRRKAAVDKQEKRDRLFDQIHEADRETVKRAFKRASTPDPGSPAFKIHKAYAGLRRPALMEGLEEPMQPAQGLFSSAADTNLRVLYHLMRANLVKGQIHGALVVCHNILDSYYTEAEDLIPKLQLLPYSNKARVLREKIAGAWCLYAHLFLQITETGVFLGEDEQCKGADKTSPLSREDFSRNEMEEQLWDYSIALLSFCSSCPLAGNHASITLALSRLRSRRRAHRKLRTFPPDGVMKGTRSYFSKLVGSADHWKNNLELAMGVCKGALDRRSWRPESSATAGVSRSGKYAGLNEPLDLHAAAESVSLLVSKLQERNIKWSTCDALEKGYKEAKMPPAFFTVLFSLPKRLQECLEKERQSAAKQARPVSYVPYLYDDAASAQLICKEANCLSRLVQSVHSFTESSQLQLICDPEKLEYEGTDVSCVDGVAWEDCLFFQSMNFVLVEETEATKAKYKYVQKLPTDAADFFVPSASGSDWRNSFQVDGYAKYPSNLVYSNVEHRCSRCDALFNTTTELESHKDSCNGDGTNFGGHSLHLAWDDVSSKGAPHVKDGKKATPSKSGTTRVLTVERACHQSFKNATMLDSFKHNKHQPTEATVHFAAESLIPASDPPEQLLNETNVQPAEEPSMATHVQDDEQAAKPKKKRGRPKKKKSGSMPKKTSKGPKRKACADLNGEFDKVACDEDNETVMTSALPPEYIKQTLQNGIASKSNGIVPMKQPTRAGAKTGSGVPLSSESAVTTGIPPEASSATMAVPEAGTCSGPLEASNEATLESSLPRSSELADTSSNAKANPEANVVAAVPQSSSVTAAASGATPSASGDATRSPQQTVGGPGPSPQSQEKAEETTGESNENTHVPPMLDESHDGHEYGHEYLEEAMSVSCVSAVSASVHVQHADDNEPANQEQEPHPKGTLVDYVTYTCKKCMAADFSAESERDQHERDCRGQSSHSSLAEPWPSFSQQSPFAIRFEATEPLGEGPTPGKATIPFRLEDERPNDSLNDIDETNESHPRKRRVSRKVSENSARGQRVTRSAGSPPDQRRRSRRSGGPPSDPSGIPIAKKKTALVGS